MMNKNNYKAFYTLLYIVTVSLLMVTIDVHAHDLNFNVTRLSAKDGLSRAARQGWIHLAIHPRRHEPIRRLPISEFLEVQQQCKAEKLFIDSATYQRQYQWTNLGIYPEQYLVLLRP